MRGHGDLRVLTSFKVDEEQWRRGETCKVTATSGVEGYLVSAGPTC